MSIRTLLTATAFAALTVPFLGLPTGAETPKLPKLDICDPYLTGEFNQSGDRTETAKKVAHYDKEKVEVVKDEAAVIDLLAEEKWDPATGAEIKREKLCVGTPTYVANWAELVGPGTDGKDAVLANGTFVLRKDGTFGFDFNKRPYDGKWAWKDGKVELTSPWINGGQPYAVPVERVETPVDATYADGKTDSYVTTVYRIGPFRLQPVDTTVKGAFMDCACPTN